MKRDPGRLPMALPEVEHDRLAGGLEPEARVDRQCAGGRAQILGKAEVGDVRRQEVDRRLDTVVQLDL